MRLDKLRGILAEKRITQKDLAKSLNLSLLSVNRKLNGHVPITVEEAAKIVEFAKIEDPVAVFFK